MSNAFSKEERVAFDQILEGFEDQLILSKNVNVYRTDDVTMERTGNVMWRPQPYIAQSFSGTDMTSNFKDYTQLSVPATLGFSKSVPWTMSATELRDALQENRLGNAAKQKLASDINVAVMNTAANYGTLVVKRTTAAAGYDDAAQCDAIMNEQGVPAWDRYLALSTRDYNGMASNLAASTRSFTGTKSSNAYERSYVGPVAGFETYKLDYANRIAAAAGTVTMDTRSSASNYYTPKATSTAATGEVSNVDNRYQTITVSSTTGVVAGDCFTIANCNAVHHITKSSTGQSKTFRVISVTDSTHMVISPPIISNQGSTDAEAEYQNCTFSSTASNASLTFLNTAAAPINCFWQKDAIELLPGRYAVPAEAGTAVMRASTEQGIELVMQKWYDINTMKTKFRIDTLFGVAMVQPEMAGIMLFSQS